MKNLLRLILLLSVALLLSGASSINSYRVAATGLPLPVLWYKFNDASGTTAADSSGNGNNGTLIGSPPSSWITGPNGNGAINFANTQAQYVSAGNPTAVRITGALTITGWVRMTSFVDSSIIAKDAAGQRAYNVDYNVTAAAFRFYINGGGAGGNEVKTTTSPSSGTWYFLAATYQPGGSGTLKIYLNGSLQATSTTGDATIPTSTAELEMGSRAYVGFEDKMNGDLDDARIYNVVLSSTDIAAIYAAGAQ